MFLVANEFSSVGLSRNIGGGLCGLLSGIVFTTVSLFFVSS